MNAFDSLLAVLALEEKTWTCSHCGENTTMLSEVCDACGIEDCSQGTDHQPTAESFITG
jgi:hypothetical protein